MVAIGVYHVVFAVAMLFYGPVMLWRMVTIPGYRRGLRQRMGWVPRTSGAQPVVWVHGVSVGEVKAASTLIERLRAEYPTAELVLSSTTPTGHGLARKLHPDLRVFYYPLDFGLFPRRALDRVRPACVLLVELEVWPNFLQAAAKRRIPVAVVNGRMSERSFGGYRLVRRLLPQFQSIACFCVQDESYRRRLRALSIDPRRICVTGNIKYDSVALKDASARSAEVRAWLSPDDRIVLVGGSTHGEEDIGVARVARALEQRLARRIRLVLAPRHPERAAVVREALQAAGMTSVSWSALPPERGALGDDTIVVVDTIGHLETFYGACDIAFVGGSLVPHGGQNMLEPAVLGKAVVFGPHVANFRTDVRLLLEADAVVQVRDYEQLATALEQLILDPDRRAALGHRAVERIRDNQGATERTLARLRPLLDPVLAQPGSGAF